MRTLLVIACSLVLLPTLLSPLASAAVPCSTAPNQPFVACVQPDLSEDRVDASYSSVTTQYAICLPGRLYCVWERSWGNMSVDLAESGNVSVFYNSTGCVYYPQPQPVGGDWICWSQTGERHVPFPQAPQAPA